MAFNKVLLSFFALFALASLGFCEEGPVCIADGDCQVNDDTSFICNRQTGTCEKAFRPSLDNTPGCNVNEESSCPLGYTCQNNQCVRNHGIACVAGQCLDSTMTCNKLTNMCAPAAPGQNRGIACVNGNCPNSMTCDLTTKMCIPCVDLHAPGRASDCPRRKYLCENTLYYNVMTIQCPKTCGRCGQNSSIPRIQIQNCVDKSSDCKQKKDRCHNSAYANFMAQQCPFTCGKC